MGYGLVGLGSVVGFGNAGNPVSPTFSAAQQRTTGHLLTLWCGGAANPTLPTTPPGWLVAAQAAGSGSSATVFYKYAVGSDAAPTIAGTPGVQWVAQLGEFLGNATTGVVDQRATATTTTTTMKALAGGRDASTAGELVVCASCAFYSTSAARTLVDTLNNGVMTEQSNNATVSPTHYCFGYSITTGNSAPDQDAWSTSTSANMAGASLAMASFQPPPFQLPQRIPTNYAAVNRGMYR